MTKMPTIGEHRGVAIHAFQSQERIDQIVKPAIDAVFLLQDPVGLFSYLRSARHPPEARLLAAASVKAISEQAADKRVPRPDIDLEKVDAWIAGLDSIDWVCPDRYATDLDVDGGAADARPVEFQNELAEYLKSLGTVR